MQTLSKNHFLMSIFNNYTLKTPMGIKNLLLRGNTIILPLQTNKP
tara:strand:- start:1291 stop:1425 length:135 start_codon:yes stop_codon:yes gene_type:complete